MESDCFVRFGGHLASTWYEQLQPQVNRKETCDEILISGVGSFLSLLPCTHESPSGQHACLDMWEVNLYHHAFLAGINVPDLRDSVRGSSNFEESLTLHHAHAGSRGEHQFRIFGITSGTPSKVSLMLFALRMCKVGSFVRVKC